MEMIIGGAFQGKNAYAKETYPDVAWVSGASASEEELLTAKGICGFHEYIRRLMQEGKEVSNLAETIIRENPTVILVTDEVGYGVVPVDAFDRAYREAVGRVCTELAAYCTRVVRVICGIGVVIKDA